jgi:hypothetical protein
MAGNGWQGTDAATQTCYQRGRQRNAPLLHARVFQTFYVDYHIAVGHVVKLAVPNLDEIVAELRLKTSSG